MNQLEEFHLMLENFMGKRTFSFLEMSPVLHQGFNIYHKLIILTLDTANMDRENSETIKTRTNSRTIPFNRKIQTFYE